MVVESNQTPGQAVQRNSEPSRVGERRKIFCRFNKRRQKRGEFTGRPHVGCRGISSSLQPSRLFPMGDGRAHSLDGRSPPLQRASRIHLVSAPPPGPRWARETTKTGTPVDLHCRLDYGRRQTNSETMRCAVYIQMWLPQ